METEQGTPNNQSATVTHSESKETQEKWKKGGRLLSGLVGSNVLLFSSTLVTCVFTKDLEIWETDLLIFLCIVLIMCTAWMIFQMYFSWKHKNAILYKDGHAGPIWMKAFQFGFLAAIGLLGSGFLTIREWIESETGGIVLFGTGTLIMTILRIGHAVEYLDCETPMKIIHPVIQAMFVITQTCFLWVSCKHCVQIYMNATRCGLMVLMSINLTLWVIAVTEEARYHTIEIQRYLQRNATLNNSNEAEEAMVDAEDVYSCSCQSVCKFLPTEYYYLYPFNIEYNLFAAAMLYIMWKNVGRQIDDSGSQHFGLGPGVRKHIPLFGLVTGVSVLVTGLVMFILYEVGREKAAKRWLSLTTFYIFHVICLGLMCTANLVGIIIFKLDKRSMDNEKNPSRTLDMALLLGATLAQYGISYYSIIAMIATAPFTVLNFLTLVYSLLMIIQHSLQNVFIIEGLYRLPPIYGHKQTEINKLPKYPEAIQEGTTDETDSPHSVNYAPQPQDNVAVPRMTRRATLAAQLKTHLKKRKVMKDIYLFLFLSNIIFWIMPAFGARIMFDTGMEVRFYGFTIWAVITNICLPFGIFYRMHAAASLLELYSMS